MFTDEPFTIENEQLTPSMKIRRHIISRVYGEGLGALYQRAETPRGRRVRPEIAEPASANDERRCVRSTT